MTASERDTTIHASAVLVDNHAVLIRGPSGSGKSRLAFDLVGDDRVHVSAVDGLLMVRPAASLAGLLEVRGLGIRRLAFAAQGQVALVVDLDAGDAERLPGPNSLEVTLDGVKVPRIPVHKGLAALPLVIAALITSPAAVS